MRFRYLLLILLLTVPVSVDAGSSSSEMLIAWWGDMQSVYYPPTEPLPETIASVKTQLKAFRVANPKALLLDVGGFAGPLVSSESSYDLPPFPLYRSLDVAAVNVGKGDWGNLMPADLMTRIPEDNQPPMLSTGRLADGSTPPAIQKAFFRESQGVPLILAGATRIPALDFAPDETLRLNTDDSPVSILRQALAPLKYKNPEATTVVMADLTDTEIDDLVSRVEGIDLILQNQVTEKPKPRKVGERTWVVNRYGVGALTVGRIVLGTGGAIEKVELEKVPLLPEEKPKGNLWTWMGLSSPKISAPRLYADPPKPIVGINLRDPKKIVEEMGYENVACEAYRCMDISDSLRDRVSNNGIVSFNIVLNGTDLGRLYRVHHDLPNSNGNLFVNLILDKEGRIVRASEKINPVIGMRFIALSKVLESWEGKKPEEIEITYDRYPGIEEHLKLLREDLQLAAEIHAVCP